MAAALDATTTQSHRMGGGAPGTRRESPRGTILDVSTSRRQVRCIMCGRVGPRSVEDVFPLWLAAAVGGLGPFYTTESTQMKGQEESSRERKTGSLANVKVKNVCHSCNTGWMSRLENDVKDLILAMVSDQSVTLDSHEQRHLAAWCQLKALTLDAWYPDRFMPPELLHRFTNFNRPIMSSIVDIARFPPPGPGMGPLRGRLIMQVDAAGYGLRDAIRVTWSVGHLATSVVVCAGLPVDLPLRIEREERGFLQIFPILHDRVTWPPAEPIP